MPPILTLENSQRCCGCKQRKLLSEFYPNKARPRGVHSQCKVCSRAYAREWTKKPENRTKILVAHKRLRAKKIEDCDVRFFIIKKLSSTREAAKRHGHKACTATIDELVPLFHGVCNACGEYAGRGICLDHCHETGRFRGFLCNGCNTALGYVHDSIEKLDALIVYLQTR